MSTLRLIFFTCIVPALANAMEGKVNANQYPFKTEQQLKLEQLQENLKEIITNKQDINTGQLLLSSCEDDYYHEVTQQLLERGANPNITDGINSAPLHRAFQASYQSKRFNLKTINLLLHYRADVNIKNLCRLTPLLYLCLDLDDLNLRLDDSIRFKLLRKFLKKGADPNDRLGSTGGTCLHILIQCPFRDSLCKKFIQRIIQAGGSLAIKDDLRRTPVDYACECGGINRRFYPCSTPEHIKEARISKIEFALRYAQEIEEKKAK